jgi:hypothetical protein
MAKLIIGQVYKKVEGLKSLHQHSNDTRLKPVQISDFLLLTKTSQTKTYFILYFLDLVSLISLVDYVYFKKQAKEIYEQVNK